ncbi:ImmA/IrrE family metallo-endopeptidase [Sphingobium chungangianum]|jgi:Zn-dependent peptidase ImmA (M78 family)/DNA-binding XRE family transcriptional regulator
MSNDRDSPASAGAKPIPERIREAREARGLSGENLAEIIGVSRQAVAQFETGQASPGGETMSKIIAETGQPISFFTSMPVRPGEPRSPFFRSLKRMEQQHRRRIVRRMQWAGDIGMLLERFIDLPAVNFPEFEFDADSGDEDDIERAAEKLRDHWGLGRGPIRSLGAVMEANGILLVREPVRCQDMDAVSCWIGGRAIVLLSKEITSGPRDLFNLAHELGHLVLHPDVEVNSTNLDMIEKQANRFASAFLLPRETFSQEVLGSSLAFFKSLKARWGVAIAAMAYRSRDLGILSENQFSYLFRQMNAQRIRKVEPLDDAFSVNQPGVLAEGLRMLVEHGVHTRAQIEASLGLNLRDVEAIAGLSEGYLDQRVVPIRFRRPISDEG